MASGKKRGALGGGHLLGIFFLLALLMGVVFTLGYLLGRGQYDPKLREAVTNLAGEPALAARKLTSDKPAALARRVAPERSAPELSAPDRTSSRNSLRNSLRNSPQTSRQNSLDADGPGPAGESQPTSRNWDFYRSAEPAKAVERLSPRRQTDNGGASPARSSVPAKSKSQTGTSKAPSSLNPPLIPRGTIVLQVAALAHESDALAMAEALRKKKFPAFVLSPDADKFYRVQVGPYADAKSAAAARQRLEAAGFKTITKK